MPLISHMNIDFNSVMVPAIVALSFMTMFLIIRILAVRFLQKRADRAKSKFEDIVIRALKTPSVYWCIAIGLYIGIDLSELPQKYVFYLSKIIHSIVILSITIAAANLSVSVVREYTQKLNVPVPATGLAYGVIKWSIIVVGCLIILGMLGVSITPLITALGVGGLAIALALKDTLENLFAGIHILVEKSVRVGDFVKIETGQEGYVEDITWRTTRIRMLQDSIVVIPNSKLSQSVVINYSLPEKSMFIQIPFSAGYSADPDRVEHILLDETKKAFNEVQGLLPEPEPTVEFMPSFGEGSLVFNLNCRVRDFTGQYRVKDMLRKRIFRRFKEEGIEIPVPQRVVHMRGENNES